MLCCCYLKTLKFINPIILSKVIMATEVVTQKATDVSEISELLKVTIKNDHSQVLAPEKLGENNLYVLAVRYDEIVGGIGSFIYDGKDAEIDVFAIEGDYRNPTLERDLLGELMADLRLIGVGSVRVIPEPHREEFYRSNGFEVGAEDNDYLVHKF
jgi:ribosomal protein S18 acetylase RimI-like enzyme